MVSLCGNGLKKPSTPVLMQSNDAIYGILQKYCNFQVAWHFGRQHLTVGPFGTSSSRLAMSVTCSNKAKEE